MSIAGPAGPAGESGRHPPSNLGRWTTEGGPVADLGGHVRSGALPGAVGLVSQGGRTEVAAVGSAPRAAGCCPPTQSG